MQTHCTCKICLLVHIHGSLISIFLHTTIKGLESGFKRKQMHGLAQPTNISFSSWFLAIRLKTNTLNTTERLANPCTSLYIIKLLAGHVHGSVPLMPLATSFCLSCRHQRVGRLGIGPSLCYCCCCSWESTSRISHTFPPQFQNPTLSKAPKLALRDKMLELEATAMEK